MRLTCHLYFKDNDVDLHLVYTFDQKKKHIKKHSIVFDLALYLMWLLMGKH